jgi:uncharacterized protein HemX
MDTQPTSPGDELSPESRRELAAKMRQLGQELAPLLHEALNSDRKRELVALLRQRGIHLSGGDWTLEQIEALVKVAKTFAREKGLNQ